MTILALPLSRNPYPGGHKIFNSGSGLCILGKFAVMMEEDRPVPIATGHLSD